MKFTIVVVMLALALGVESSVLPWHSWAPSWAHTTVWGNHHEPIWADHHGAIVSHSAYVAHPSAGISLTQGPAWGHHHVAPIVHAVHAPVVAHPHEGHYVAETRGAVHTAPLAGHVNSVSSVNVAPAPGTV